MRHTSARSAQFLRVLVGIERDSLLFRRCVFRTPPRDLHSNYHNLYVSEVRPTWDFIILNKGRMTPPWRKKAKGSQAQCRVQNFNQIFVPSRARVKSFSPNWTTNLHQSDSDRCRSKYDLEIVMFTTENKEFDAIQFLAQPCMRTEHKGCLSWPQATHHVEALVRWTFSLTATFCFRA